MSKRNKHNADFVVTVESDKCTGALKTLSVFDNRTQERWSEEKIQERGIKTFSDIKDLKDTLNWNLGGDSSKYQFEWGQSGKATSDGRAYIFQ